MKKRNKNLILAVIVITAVILSFAMIPSEEEKIKSEIEKANYCETKDDCIHVSSQCPFGCYVFVNENEVERISGLIENFESDCTYSCIALNDYDCVNNKCEAYFDSPN